MPNLLRLNLIAWLFAALPVCAATPASKPATAPAAPEMVPLRIELPPPVFGPPPRIPGGNDFDIPGEPKPPFMLPRSATNVALGAPVTLSERNPVIGDASLMTDGDNNGVESCFIEMAAGLAWAQLDLGASMPVWAINLWHYHAETRIYHDVIIQVSDDPAFKKGVITLFNNDRDNSSKLGQGADREYLENQFGKLIDGRRTAARYVRCFSNGNTSDALNHLIEVQVYAVPTAEISARLGALSRRYESPEAFARYVELFSPGSIQVEAGKVVGLVVPVSDERDMDMMTKFADLRTLRVTRQCSDLYFNFKCKFPASLRVLDITGAAETAERVLNAPEMIAGVEELRIAISAGTGRDAIKNAAKLKNLQTLHVAPDAACGPEVLNLEPLIGHAKLRRLSFAGSRVGDANMLEVSRLTNLESLDLAKTAVTDAGIRRLAALPMLKQMDLANTAVTDAAIPTLVGFSSLEELNLTGTRITAQGVERIRSARPGVKVPLGK